MALPLTTAQVSAVGAAPEDDPDPLQAAVRPMARIPRAKSDGRTKRCGVEENIGGQRTAGRPYFATLSMSTFQSRCGRVMAESAPRTRVEWAAYSRGDA